MNYMQMIDTRSKTTGISGIFSAYGDFGIVDGAELNRVVIQIFCKILNQKFVTVYPVLNKDMLYCINGKEIAGYEIAEKGLQIDLQDLQGLTIDIVSKN